MEHRFRAPDGREWVAIDTPSAEVLAGYPEGTVEIPMEPVEPSDLVMAKNPQTIATAKLSLLDGIVSGFTVDSAIAGGVQIDTGKFFMFFAIPFEDVDYIVNVFDGGLYRCYVQPEDYFVDSFIVTTTDLLGTPADPACISIIIMKAI